MVGGDESGIESLGSCRLRDARDRDAKGKLRTRHGGDVGVRGNKGGRLGWLED